MEVAEQIELDPRVAAALGLEASRASAEDVAERVARLCADRSPSRDEARSMLVRVVEGFNALLKEPRQRSIDDTAQIGNVVMPYAIEQLDIPMQVLCATDLGLLDVPLETLWATLGPVNERWALDMTALYALQCCVGRAIGALTVRLEREGHFELLGWRD